MTNIEIAQQKEIYRLKHENFLLKKVIEIKNEKISFQKEELFIYRQN